MSQTKFENPSNLLYAFGDADQDIEIRTKMLAEARERKESITSQVRELLRRTGDVEYCGRVFRLGPDGETVETSKVMSGYGLKWPEPEVSPDETTFPAQEFAEAAEFGPPLTLAEAVIDAS